MKTDENNPRDWLRSARTRLHSADLLHPLEGATESVIELLQEATERFLKAYYLLSRGWKLRKIHDLGALVAEAVDRDPRFSEDIYLDLDPDGNLVSMTIEHARTAAAFKELSNT